MIRLTDDIQAEGNKEVRFNNLNEVLLNCFSTVVDTVDENYTNWIQYYLDNPNKLDDITITKKIKEIKATGYELKTMNGDEYAKKGICQICGDEGVKTHIYNDVDYNSLSACTACIGVEDRNSPYRYSKKIVKEKFLELKELTKDINSLESFIEFAKANINKFGFHKIEFDGQDFTDYSESKLKEYFEGTTEPTILRFDWHSFLVYMDPDSFELDTKIWIGDSEGEDICDNIQYDEFYYENHEPSYL